MTVADVQQGDETLGGTLMFTGARVAVRSLLDSLERSSLEEFLLDFPTVTRAQASSIVENTSVDGA